MDLKDIASVSGKPGLYKVIKPTRTGVILEAIDEQKTRIIANTNNRVSLLKEISIYTNGKESSILLENVFQQIHEKLGGNIPVNGKSSNEELQSFLVSIIPNYDTDKVYVSDIKKLVTWYALVAQYFPEKFVKQSDQVGSKKETESKEPGGDKAVTGKPPKAKETSADNLEAKKDGAKPKAKSSTKK